MARPKQAEFKPTLSTRITMKELGAIDEIAASMGQSRSEWLLFLVRQSLGQNPASTVRSMETRIIALEAKFNRLAG